MHKGNQENSYSDTEEAEELSGNVVRVTFQSEDSGFVVFKLESYEEPSVSVASPITVVANTTTEVHQGMSLVLHGHWTEHDKFGLQFRASSVRERRPTSKAAITRYLAGSNIKGFGPSTAERIVEAFGEDSLRIIEEQPEKLLRIPGIGRKKLEEIRAGWGEKRKLPELSLLFHELEIPAWLQKKLLEKYGTKAGEIIQKNPYRLVADINGVGFKTADAIALRQGIDERSDMRVRAALLYALERARDDGHCYVPRDRLLSKLEKVLGYNDIEAFRDAADQLVSEGMLLSHAERLFLPELDEAERDVANAISGCIHARGPAKEIPDSIVSSYADKPILLGDASLTLSPEQRTAIRLVAEHTLVVITGGPGCGKTTVVRAISGMLRAAGLRIKLAAPTGRAAQRLSEVCEIEGSTIHRLLGFDPFKRAFIHNKDEPLELDALIVDETSMVDILLAQSLLDALPAGARIILVGDADQLPSVGPGSFLRDLLRLEALPRVRLQTLFRRTAESRITQVAHDINAGCVPKIPAPDGKERSEAYFLAASEPENAGKLVEQLVVDQIPKKFGFDPSDITVLSPMNQGELGIAALNRRLQSKLVPDSPSLPRVATKSIELRLGDRVCQRVNNYTISSGGVFNGDQGTVVGVDSVGRAITVELWDGREIEYGRDNISELDLAYALTIHRAQGSEMPVVVLVLHDSHYVMLERQLVYTALTRAKELLVVVGTKKALIVSSKRSRSRRRFTSLYERITQQLEGLDA